MKVREWDPATAPESEIEAWRTVYNRALAHDLPDEPQWQSEKLREYLAVTMPAEELAVDGDDVVGHAHVLLHGDLGVIEVYVQPDLRGHGMGRALLSAAARRAHDTGHTSLGVEVVASTPGVGFYERYGFRCAYIETRNLLDLSTVDWDHIADLAGRVNSSYDIRYFPGGPHEALLEPYAVAKGVLGDDDSLELHPGSHDARRLRDSLATLHARGMTPYVVLAEHVSTGQVVGLTEVVVPAHRPGRADQYDTIVVPGHRGYGLGLAMKARMMLELRTAEPQVLDVQTWHAMEDEPLLRVNAELGFQPDVEWREYEVETPDLLRRLNS